MRRTVPCNSRLHQRICPKCNISLSLSSSSSLTRCENCNTPVRIFTCTGIACKLSEKECCESNENKNEKLSCGHNFRKCEKCIKPPVVHFSAPNNIKRICYCVAALVILLIVYCCYPSSESNEDMNGKEIKKLKSYYVSQKNETWYQVLSVLEKEIPSVKSITFLYEKDKKTLNCLTNKLVALYTGNDKINIKELTFSFIGSEERDYGFYLEHYHAVVEKFRVLVTDLSKVPGETARLFHSLCDEESSDIKPSLFIFTLKYDQKTADLKPLERATTILKEAWSTLPQNEIFPLLSRIIKNVVDFVPEFNNFRHNSEIYC